MKKVLISTLTLTLILILMLGLVSCVQAASLKFTPTASTTNLKEGDEITITLNLSDIDMGEDGINSFGGKLVYDENIFEKVTTSSFSSQNNWSIAYNDEATEKKGTFLATINAGAKDNQTIGTLKLKVKKNIKSTTTKVQFTELSSVAEDTVTLGNQTIIFNVTGTVKDEDEDKNQGNEQLNIITGDNTNKKPNIVGGSKNNTTNTGKDNTVSNKGIPQTGVQNTAIVLSIATLAIIATVAYTKFKKNKEIK